MSRDNLRAATVCALLLCAATVALLRHERSGASSASAQATARAMSTELMSPFCPGRTLATCPSPAAAVLRSEMAARLQGGESRESVVADLVERFGTDVLGVPEARGVGLLLWVVPVAIGVMVLAAMLASASVREVRASRPGAPLLERPDGTMALRLDEELAALD